MIVTYDVVDLFRNSIDWLSAGFALSSSNWTWDYNTHSQNRHLHTVPILAFLFTITAIAKWLPPILLHSTCSCCTVIPEPYLNMRYLSLSYVHDQPITEIVLPNIFRRKCQLRTPVEIHRVQTTHPQFYVAPRHIKHQWKKCRWKYEYTVDRSMS